MKIPPQANSDTDIYDIHLHTHLFAAWAASRAASTGQCKFSVLLGRGALENAGLTSKLSSPDDLPNENEIDHLHKRWRNCIIEFATAKHNARSKSKSKEFRLTHGVAAKLINIYLKCRFVNPAYCANEKVKLIHPPIDSLLIDKMAEHNFGGDRKFWKERAPNGWSNLKSDEYQNIIDTIRDSTKITYC
jgi:hypothetical protein